MKKTLFFMLMLVPTFMFAQNLGVYGSIYPIQELDMLVGLHQKLQTMKATGELARAQHDFIRQSRQHVLRPKAIDFVTDLGDQPPQTHTFDPTIRVSRDITTPDGQLIAKAGTIINPLNTVHLQETLVFINGDNKEQLIWLKKQKRKMKVILVKGNIEKATKTLQQKIYFDQAGILCQRFQITHTPTLVDEDAKKPQLIVTEQRYE
jgi:conjugal transfer pilus assembly protein TraW